MDQKAKVIANQTFDAIVAMGLINGARHLGRRWPGVLDRPGIVTMPGFRTPDIVRAVERPEGR